MGSNVKSYLAELAQYMHARNSSEYPLPKVKINNQPQEPNSPFITTGYYDSGDKCITLFAHGRHMKDVLRTFAHEMIHYYQDMEGQFENGELAHDDPKYAQNDPHLRKMEEDANLRGSMWFRDWTDNKKYGK
jgi:hypothetical protein